MITNLFLILCLSVLDNLWNQGEEYVFEELPSEDHLGPIMTLLQHV